MLGSSVQAQTHNPAFVAVVWLTGLLKVTAGYGVLVLTWHRLLWISRAVKLVVPWAGPPCCGLTRRGIPRYDCDQTSLPKTGDLMSDQQNYNRQLIADFRTSRERGDGRFAGRPLLLLTTTGAKSGRLHTTPMMYIEDGDRLLVIASNAGAERDPDWYRNLVAHPEVTVEVGANTYPANAVVLAGAERAQKWDEVVAAHAFFGDHQAHITREIPVVALVRRAS